MTRQTSLHGWTVPTEGDENYEDTFDDFFVNLDINGELRDVESNLQNYSPKSGAKFVATDTENRYIGDGSTWNKVASSGKNPNFDSVNTNELTNDSGLTVSRTALEAQTPIIDDWERQTTDYLSVDLGSFSITTSTVLQGSAALRGDGHVRTPHKTRRGFRYQFYVYFEDTGGTSLRDQWIGFSTQEGTFFLNGDGYYVLIRGQADEIRIGRNDAGSGSVLASATATVPKSEYLRVEVEIEYGDIRLAVYQLDGTQVGTSINANDDTYLGDFFLQLKHDNRNSGDENITDEIKRSVI